MSSDPSTFRRLEAANGYAVLKSVLEICERYEILLQFSPATQEAVQAHVFSDHLLVDKSVPGKDHIHDFPEWVVSLFHFRKAFEKAEDRYEGFVKGEMGSGVRRLMLSGISGIGSYLLYQVLADDEAAPWWGGGAGFI